MSFPKIIHQIWFQGANEMPDYAKESIKSFKQVNPDFEHHLWDEKGIRGVIKKHFAYFLETWENLRTMHQKIDTGKAAIAYAEGGFMADMDTIAVRPLGPILEEHADKDIIVGKIASHLSVITYISRLALTTKPVINNAMYAAKKKSKMMEKVILATYYRSNMFLYTDAINTYFIGGVRMFNVVVLAGEYEKDVAVVGSQVFEAQDSSDPSSLVIHQSEMTWVPSVLRNVGSRRLGIVLNVLLGFLVALWIKRQCYLPAGFLIMQTLLVMSSVAELFVIGRCTNKMRIENRHMDEVLPDKGFELVPRSRAQNSIWVIKDGLLALLMCAFGYKTTIMVCQGDSFAPTVALGSVLVLRILRSLCVTIINQPPPPDRFLKPHIIMSIFDGQMDDLIHPVNHGGDYFFSGHMSLALIAYLWLIEFYVTPRKRPLAYFTAVPFVMFYTYLILAARSHYTVDIVVAVVLTVFVFAIAKSLISRRMQKLYLVYT